MDNIDAFHNMRAIGNSLINYLYINNPDYFVRIELLKSSIYSLQMIYFLFLRKRILLRFIFLLRLFEMISSLCTF